MTGAREDRADFSVRAAARWAGEGRLEEWVHEYLNTGSWANPAFSAGLRLQQRWWRGPVLVPLKQLVRVCGPEKHMEYRGSSEAWEERLKVLGTTLGDPLDLPPLIVLYRKEGPFQIRDGNHRYEAALRKGWKKIWVLLWYLSEAEWRQDAMNREGKGW